MPYLTIIGTLPLPSPSAGNHAVNAIVFDGLNRDRIEPAQPLYCSPSSSSFSERRFKICAMACISASERSSIFKRASVARRYSRTLWRYSDIILRHRTPVTIGNGGSGKGMITYCWCRRRGPFGVQPRYTQELPVLRSRTVKWWAYSLLPKVGRKCGGSPELLCETRVRESPLPDRLSHKSRRSGLPGGRRQVVCGSGNLVCRH